ncbi:hypothetical protein GEU84_020775 [Fertoebacter nigrum]|uniref:Uncharacterized protein n=1 Tax=Fertoeibacter niger TaxID=2656921 RepID=A0A8X8KSR8_9RHOB|nr:portal protein [Fertoeibacter niger]NUB46822.1 hypothetical protein [Fertoeibacter niger]
MDTGTIKKKLALAKADRALREPMFDDAIRLTMPLRKRFHQVEGRDAGEDIFDETGVNAVAEFASRMQAGLMPPFTNFLKLQASSLVDAKDRKAINRDLDEICEFAFEEIWASNFSQEVSESIYDMGISTGTLLVEEGRGGQSLMHRALSITEIYLERGANDAVGGIFRVSKCKAKDLAGKYRGARIEGKTANTVLNEADKELTVVEYTREEWGDDDKATHHIVMVEDHDEIIVERTMQGMGSNPFITHRWATTAGEVWGRGPILNALAAIRTTNLMVEMVLENAAMSIVGIYQTDNEGTINADTVSLLPGTILNKEIGTNGLEPVNAATGSFNMQDVVLGDQRLNIKRALFNDMLSDPNKTPATATEVAERMADLAHRSTAGYSRLYYELLLPYMWRVLHILQKRGDIQMPVQRNRAVSIVAVSPLAVAQHGREMQRLVQHHQIMAGVYGPQTAAAAFKLEKLVPWLTQRSGLSEDLFASAPEIAAAMQKQSEDMMKMQQAAEAQGQGAMGR